MSMMITTRSSQGLRAQGSGGQAVIDAHQTIDRYLRRTLSAEHANLFAEPIVTGIGGDVDWYTSIESAGNAVPLEGVPEPRKTQILTRLSALVTDIRECAAGLKTSSRQSDRLLGQLLLIAIEVPSEEFVFALGDQPVLIFWGHLRDVSLPESGVVDRMIAKRIMPRQSAQPPIVAPSVEPESPAPPVFPAPSAPSAAGPRVGAHPQVADALPVEFVGTAYVAPVRHPWLVPLLWAAFIGVCVVIALRLLAACALGSPFGSSLWLSYCPGKGPGNPSEIADLESQNTDLQRQLDRLLGNLEGRRAECAKQAPAKPEPPPEPPPPNKLHEIIRSCEGADCLAKLKGCWGVDTPMGDAKRHLDGTTEEVPGSSHPAHMQWCFNDEKGNGTFEMWQTEAPFHDCKGPVRAESPEPGEIVVNVTGDSQSSCNNGSTFITTTFACKTNPQNEVSCRFKDGLKDLSLKPEDRHP